MSLRVLPCILTAAVLLVPASATAQNDTTAPKITSLKPAAAMSGDTYTVKIQLDEEARVGMVLQVRESASTKTMLTVAKGSKLVPGGKATTVTLTSTKKWFPKQLPDPFFATLKVTAADDSANVAKATRKLEIKNG